MALSAALCIAIGSFPERLYALLPFHAEFRPYSLDHVAAQLQLLFWSALAFTILVRTGIYPPELVSTNLDFDWFYRRLGRSAAEAAGRAAGRVWASSTAAAGRLALRLTEAARSRHEGGSFSTNLSHTSSMVFWTTVLLAAYLILSYL